MIQQGGYAQRMMNPSGFSQFSQPGQGTPVPRQQGQHPLASRPMDDIFREYMMAMRQNEPQQVGGMSGGMFGGGGYSGGGSKSGGWGGALKGGASGAATGSAFGPWGTAIGGVLGALYGGLS